MGDSQEKTSAIRLSESEHGSLDFLVHPEDDDLFVRTGKQVIASCRLGIGFEAWLSDFTDLLADVHKWAGERSVKIQSCYCVPQSDRIVYFFATKPSQFDFDLAEELADLNIRLMNNYNVGAVELRQIPANEVERFIDLESSRAIYDNTRREHPTAHPTVDP